MRFFFLILFITVLLLLFFLKIPEPPATYVGALYNPQLQPDFGGLYFDLHDDRLLQLDIRDVKGDLITPQQMYDKLRPGTLLLYCINLHVYNIQNRGQDDPGFRRVCNHTPFFWSL